MSFFDEADEPRTPPRTARRRPSGTGRRPPGDEQAILIRRAVAVGAIVIAVILIVIGVHSCQVSARNSALRDYTDNVSGLIQQSDQLGASLFSQLSGGSGASSALALQQRIDEDHLTAEGHLSKVKHWSVPSEMQAAQQNLVLALQMRADAIGNIASQIQPALGTSTSRDAITAIATETARLYASDVVYKDYTTTAIVSAMHGAGLSTNGSINGGQFVPDIQWLTPSYIAGQLNVSLPAAAPSSVTLTGAAVGTNTMVPGVTNHVSASPPPTFTLTVANNGHTSVSNLPCSVTVAGEQVTGRSKVTVPAGQTASCSVTLSGSPTKALDNVTAQIGTVATKKTTLTFPVQFL